MIKDHQRVPENSAGDFYVERDRCMRCCVPHGEAPELLNDPTIEFQERFFRRQPISAEDVDRALRAITLSCIRALCYHGSDPAILSRLRQLGRSDCCDVMPERPTDRNRRAAAWWRRLFRREQ
jgi:hypothetical protein